MKDLKNSLLYNEADEVASQDLEYHRKQLNLTFNEQSHFIFHTEDFSFFMALALGNCAALLQWKTLLHRRREKLRRTITKAQFKMADNRRR